MEPMAVVEMFNMFVQHVHSQECFLHQIVNCVHQFPKLDLSANAKIFLTSTLQSATCLMQGNVNVINMLKILVKGMKPMAPSTLMLDSKNSTETVPELQMLKKAIESGVPMHVKYNRQTDTSVTNVMLSTNNHPIPNVPHSPGSDSPGTFFAPGVPFVQRMEETISFPNDPENLRPKSSVGENSATKNYLPEHHSVSETVPNQLEPSNLQVKERRHTDPAIPPKSEKSKTFLNKKNKQQCIRQAFMTFLNHQLPAANSWFVFERFGLELSDQDINHIEETNKDSFSKKFLKLQKWSEGRPFTCEEDVHRELEETVKKMETAKLYCRE